jgi:hypothetical protein
MAHKKLLTEREVRKFMKLASLGGLSENYFSSNLREEEEEDEFEVGLDPAAEDGMPPMDDMEEPEMEEPVEDEMGMEASPENEELLQRVVQAVAAELGVEVDVETSADEEGGDNLEVDAELEEPMPEDGEELELGGMGMGPEEEEEMPLQEKSAKTAAYTRAQMVAEITSRVTARLKKANHQEKVATELTERIFKRLTSRK